MSEDARTAVDGLLSLLRSRIDSLDALEAALGPPLDALQLVPCDGGLSSHLAGDRDSVWSRLPQSDLAFIVRNRVGAVQSVLSTVILVDWSELLHTDLDGAGRSAYDRYLLPFFCPHLDNGQTSPWTDLVALSAYLILLDNVSSSQAPGGRGDGERSLTHPLIRTTALSLLKDIASRYTLFRFFKFFTTRSVAAPANAVRTDLEWMSFVTLFLSIPTKVANACSEKSEQIPSALTWEIFMSSVTRDVCRIVAATRPDDETAVRMATFLLGKAIRSGFMTPAPSRVDFWSVALPMIKRQVASATSKTPAAPAATSAWPDILGDLTSQDLRSFATALFGALQAGPSPQDQAPRTVRGNAEVVGHLFGPLQAGQSEYQHLWEVVARQTLLAGSNWNGRTARLVVTWLQISADNVVESARELLRLAMDLWCSKAFIARAVPTVHGYLTTVVCLALRLLPDLDAAVVTLSRSSEFLGAVSAHLSSLQPSIRLAGMFVAELVSRKSINTATGIQPLDFGDIWAEGGAEYATVEQMRALMTAQPDWDCDGWLEGLAEGADHSVEEPVEAPQANARAPPRTQPSLHTKSTSKIQVLASDFDDYDDDDGEGGDDGLKPYSMPPPPAQHELKDLEDTSAYTPAKKKASVPLYIADLSAYLKSPDDAEKVEVGIREAAKLIRRKANWGSELQDNAVDLAIALAGLQDTYSLEDFEKNRRDALIALVSCSPDKSAPALIEQYFTMQYSVAQRFAMLSSLALGARELAGLPSLLPADQSTLSAHTTDDSEAWPTQKLPPLLHNHFIRRSDQSRPDGGQTLPAVASAHELDSLTEDITGLALSQTRDAAQDSIPEAAREKLLTVRQTRRSEIRKQAARANEPNEQPRYTQLAVETFIMPLMNRFWLYLRDVATAPQDRNLGPYAGGSSGTAALLDPMILSKFLGTLAVLIDAAQNSPHYLAVIAPETLELVLSLRGLEKSDETVRTAMLQLTLVVLDTSARVDAGRTLARDFSRLTWQVKDWAEEAWRETEHQGYRVDQSGRAAAGVLLRLDEVVRKTIGYH